MEGWVDPVTDLTAQLDPCNWSAKPATSMHGMYVCTSQLAGGNPLVGPNSFKTLGEGPRLIPLKKEFPLLIVLTLEGWKAECTLTSGMQICKSLILLALLTIGEARTRDVWICSLMLYSLSYLTYIHSYIQTYINKMVYDEVIKNRRNLITVWLDYKKAFDSVPHSWIIESLKLVKIPEEIIEVIKMLMCKWRTKRHLYRETDLIKTSEVEYYKGILQGDMLSLMLFILSINPLSFILHKEEGYKLGKEKEQGEHKQETEKTSTNLSPLFLWMTLNCMQWPWRWWEPYWK